MDELRRTWDNATQFAGGDVSERWWKIISSRYSEDGRVYHNYSYLRELFDLFHKYEDKLHHAQAVSLAIFFHKLTYQPRSGDGEQQSLEQFKKFMKEIGEGHEDCTLASAVRDLLEASASNLTEAHMVTGKYGSEDVHYFLDFIMAVLGSSPEIYSQYATKIQAEYSHLSSETYRQLRLKILKNLLLIPNVYATKDFRDDRESQALSNIHSEIERISSE